MAFISLVIGCSVLSVEGVALFMSLLSIANAGNGMSPVVVTSLVSGGLARVFVVTLLTGGLRYATSTRSGLAGPRPAKAVPGRGCRRAGSHVVGCQGGAADSGLRGSVRPAHAPAVAVLTRQVQGVPVRGGTDPVSRHCSISEDVGTVPDLAQSVKLTGVRPRPGGQCGNDLAI